MMVDRCAAQNHYVARIVYQFLDRSSEACEMQSASLAQSSGWGTRVQNRRMEVDSLVGCQLLTHVGIGSIVPSSSIDI